MALTEEQKKAIRSLANSQTQQPTPALQKQPGIGTQIVQGVAKPFLRGTTNLLNLVEAGQKLQQGDIRGAGQAAYQTRDFGFLGKDIAPITTPLESIGAGAEIGSTFVPVGVAGRTATQAAKTGIRNVRPIRTMLQGAGLTGAASGVGATGAALQEPDMTAGQIAGRTAAGTLLGGAVGLAAPLIGRGVQQVAARRGGKAAQEAERAISATKLETKIPKAKQQLQERLPQNTALRNKVRQNTGVDVEDLIIEEGIPFGVKGDNLFDFSEAIEDVIPTRKQGLGNALESLLGTVQKKGNLDEVQRLAIREVRNAPKGTYKLRQDEIISKIKRIIDREKKSYGTTTGYDVLNKIKSAGYDKWDGASADARAGQAISKVIKDLIEREFADGSTQSNVIRTINRRYGNLINLENYLKKVDNRTVRGGKLGKKLNQTIGAIAGSQGGFIGSLLGSELAGRITDAVVDPTRITKSILDDMIRSGYVPPSIKAINEAKDYVLQNQADLVRKLINPETKLLQEGVPQPIQLPSEGILRSQRNIGNFNRPAVGKTVARNEEAFGALGGLEVYTDENGEKKLRFSPEKAAVGVGLMAGAKSDVGKKAIGKLKGVSDDLIKEARKYKSADDFVKNILEKNSLKINKDISVYRGSGRGIGNTTFVKGKYFADSEDFAKNFGDVQKSIIPKGTKVFDFDSIKKGKVEIIPDEFLIEPNMLTQFLIDNGVTWTKNSNSRGVEYVNLLTPEVENAQKIIQEARKFKSKIDFLKDFSTEKTFSKYRDSLQDYERLYNPAGESIASHAWRKANYLYPMGQKANVGKNLEQIWKEANKK